MKCETCGIEMELTSESVTPEFVDKTYVCEGCGNTEIEREEPEEDLEGW